MITNALALLCIAGCTAAAPAALVAEPADPAALAADMAEAARRFLAALPEAQARRARFAVDDPERLDWHYIPRSRRGIALGELDHAQRALAYGFLATALTRRGLLKATAIMALEDVLRRREQGRGAFVRDPGAYYLSVFGEPSTTATWGWRLEGHHLSLNLTLVGGTHAVAAPAFLGASPTPSGDTRVLGREEALGFQLLASLDAAQRRDAIALATAPADILAKPGAALTELPGVSAARMTAAQRLLVDALIDEALENLPREVGDRERARLAAYAPAQLVFTWAGGTSPSEPHYFRLSSPTFLYEYDNTQESMTHVHSIWHVRDAAGGDFGLDLLREHYHQHHGADGARR